MKEDRSPNHDFVLQWAQTIMRAPGARGLDYGCGRVYLVAKARASGLDFIGCDTFDGTWAAWQDNLAPGSRGAVSHMPGGVIPFDAETFDVVTSNQVFEHVSDDRLDPVLTEIARVLKPGGQLLALFPTRECWFEGHIGLYGIHRLSSARARRRYAGLCHRLGFGYYRDHIASREIWVGYAIKFLNNDVFFHSQQRIDRAFQNVFGAGPQSLAVAYMRHRIAASRFKGFRRIAESRAAAPLLEAVCLRRAGVVLQVRKD